MSTFKTLGIPYPSSISVDQHTASIGASGTLREWEARLPVSPNASSYERSEALRVIQAGLLTGRLGPPPTSPSADTTGELPAYSDISHTPGSVVSEYDLIPAIVGNLGPTGTSCVVLIPSDERSLAAVERPSWDTGTGAADEEEVLSFATTPKEQKKVLRLHAGGGYTWDRISQPKFQSNIQRDVQQALYHRKSPRSRASRVGADKRCAGYSVGEKGADRGALEPAVLVWAEEELVLKNISPMGLYETRSGRAVVVQVLWK